MECLFMGTYLYSSQYIYGQHYSCICPTYSMQPAYPGSAYKCSIIAHTYIMHPIVLVINQQHPTGLTGSIACTPGIELHGYMY